jgi:hypothetical protein
MFFFNKFSKAYSIDFKQADNAPLISLKTLIFELILKVLLIASVMKIASISV